MKKSTKDILLAMSFSGIFTLLYMENQTFRRITHDLIDEFLKNRKKPEKEVEVPGLAVDIENHKK